MLVRLCGYSHTIDPEFVREGSPAVVRGGRVTERMIEASGIEVCTESFGEPTDPPVLLVMGLGASMLWWEDDFCRGLADSDRFVIRYDHRDTGRSTSYAPGRPGYSGADLVTDAVGVLDAYGLGSAHVVGASAGGALAQLMALDHPHRVRSLVLISTSPAVPGDRDLPPPTAAFISFATEAEVDWSKRDSVIDYLVGYSRLLSGGQRPFDEPGRRDFVRRDVERARSIASLQNHDVIDHEDRPRPPLSSIAAPTVVIHGTADPMFPLAHGQALAEEIPGSALRTLDGAGHGVDRADWATIVPAIVVHTGAADPGGGAGR
jgi:pimeloyl-ACP methyl ester carboxylesterase